MLLSGLHDVALSDLPLFKLIKENLILEKQHQQQHKQNKLTHNTVNPAQGKHNDRNSGSTSGAGFQYLPPLSAYNAHEEVPFFPPLTNGSAGTFDEIGMRVEQAQKRFKSIRTFGWDFLKPIGISESMQCIREKRMTERQRMPDDPTHLAEGIEPLASHSFDLPTAFQENEPTDDVVSARIRQNNELEPEEMEDEDEDEDEDDADSYDYDAEFARVEDEQEEAERELERNISHLNRGVTRDVTIQQFVETSHIDRNPYEINDKYENSHLDVDVDNNESDDFTEIPWVDVSDTVQNVDVPRVTSLNGAIDQRTTFRSAAANIRFPDNNSDQSSDLIRP